VAGEQSQSFRPNRVYVHWRRIKSLLVLFFREEQSSTSACPSLTSKQGSLVLLKQDRPEHSKFLNLSGHPTLANELHAGSAHVGEELFLDLSLALPHTYPERRV
jgi:hypothetical protein